MFSLAITALVVALIAGILGFGVLAGTAAWIAKAFFVVGFIFFIIGLITGHQKTA